MSTTIKSGGNIVHTIVYVFLCLWGICESVYGILQVLGILPSMHPVFRLTGHLGNPGPYGGFIACITAMAITNLLSNRYSNFLNLNPISKIASKAMAICGLVILPATLSRSAWACIGITVIINLLSHRPIKQWIKHNPGKLIIIVIVLFILCLGALIIKWDSVLGRFHIWNMDIRTIAAAPLHGHGQKYIMGAYGEIQELYFRERLNNPQFPPVLVKVASCPEYPFNEYLGVGMSYGVPAMILLLIVTLLLISALWKSNSLMSGGAIALSIFASASYPMVHWQFWILLVAFYLGYIISSIEGNQKGLKSILSSILMLCLLIIGIFHIHQRNNKQPQGLLFEQGYSLFQDGKWEESNSILLKGTAISSDPMFHVIIGRNYEAMGLILKAEKEYERAHYMAPNRIYPLARLMRLYISIGENYKAIAIGQEAADIPVNNRLSSMIILHNETVSALDSLKNTLFLNEE